MSADACSPAQNAGRFGWPKMAQPLLSVSWTQRTPAGLPFGMPGMGEVIEGAVQQAPHPGRQLTWFGLADIGKFGARVRQYTSVPRTRLTVATLNQTRRMTRLRALPPCRNRSGAVGRKSAKRIIRRCSVPFPSSGPEHPRHRAKAPAPARSLDKRRDPHAVFPDALGRYIPFLRAQAVGTDASRTELSHRKPFGTYACSAVARP